MFEEGIEPFRGTWWSATLMVVSVAVFSNHASMRAQRADHFAVCSLLEPLCLPGQAAVIHSHPSLALMASTLSVFSQEMAFAAKVAVTGRLAIDRAEKAERGDDPLRREVEVFGATALSIFAQRPCLFGKWIRKGDRLGDADGVGELDFALADEPGHNVLSYISGHVGS